MPQEWTQPVTALASTDGVAPHSITKYLWPTWQRVAYSEYLTRHLAYDWRLDLTQLNTGLYVLGGDFLRQSDPRYYADFRSALRAQAALLIRNARLRLKGVDRAAAIRWTMEVVLQEGVGCTRARFSGYVAKEENERRLAVIEREAQQSRLRSEAIFRGQQASLFA